MLKYITAAFKNPWHLLALLGSLGFAVLSGHPDVAVPIVLAGETAYLGFVGTHPKFQKSVDVREHQAEQQAGNRRSEYALQKIMQSLPGPQVDRFRQLRKRCRELREIAADMQHPQIAEHDATLESLQVQGLDRLLWVYLRLLFTQHALERFLNRTSLQNMQREEQQIERRLAKIPTDNASPHQQKVRRTLVDNLATIEGRIKNYEQAEANFEYVGVELDRLENKIKSLAELAVNRQEPEYISSQIDLVANSVMETEQTMNELKYVTGLDDLPDEVPELLQARVNTVR